MKLSYEDPMHDHDDNVVGISVIHIGEQEGRQVYGWELYEIGPSGYQTLAECDDLRSGVGDEINIVKMLCTALSFLDAWAESMPDGENADLFPHDLTAAYHPDAWSEWAQDARMLLVPEDKDW